jgi:hypothetical protein
MNVALHAPEAGASEVPKGLDLDQTAARLGDRARDLARTPPAEKAALLRAISARLGETAGALAAAACRERGLDPTGPASGVGWLAGPAPAIAFARELGASLAEIAAVGRPALPREMIRKRKDGRVVARLAGRTLAERAVERGREALVVFAAGIEPEDVIAGQAAFYRQADPEGGVTLVVGGGIGDALYAVFVEGRAAALLVSSESAASARHALAPLVEKGFAAVIEGGAEEAARLAEHAAVGALSFTGEAEDLDALGSAKPTSAHTGGVGPALIVPCLYARDELLHLARTLAMAAAMGDGAAARVILAPRAWPQRQLLLALLERAFREIPVPAPPSARASARRGALLEGQRDVVRGPMEHPFALVPELEGPAAEAWFATPGAAGSSLGVVPLDAEDPRGFLAAATRFCNERLAGGPAAQIVVHPVHLEDPAIDAAVDEAVMALRYGTVGVNRWPGVARLTGALPWGSPASGFRRGARMLAGVDKAVVQGPLLPLRRPVYLHGEGALAERWTTFQGAPRLRDAWALAGR